MQGHNPLNCPARPNVADKECPLDAGLFGHNMKD